MPDDLSHLNAEAQKHRSALAHTLSELTTAFSPDALKSEAEARTLPLVNAAVDQARRNPAALAVVGAGVALFLMGPGRRADVTAPVDPAKAKGFRQETPDYTGQDARIEAAAQAMKSEDMARHLGSGLDRLPKGARKRVMQARRAAVDAQRALERKTQSLQNRTRRDPATYGALALVAGAVLGAILPGTRREDELLGETRDHLVREAEDTLRDELHKLSAHADTALRDALTDSRPQ